MNLPLPEWLLRLLSVDVEALEGGKASLRFARFPEGELGLLALLALVGAFAIVVVTYLYEGRLATWKKVSMAVVRCLLLVVLALVVFYPVLEVDRARDLSAVTLVLLDDSLSSGIVDRYQSDPKRRTNLAAQLKSEDDPITEEEIATLSRADLMNRALRHPDLRLRERLRENNRLEVYTFSDKLRRVTAPVEVDSSDRSTRDVATTPQAEAAESAPTNGETSSDEAELPPLPEVEIEPRGPVTDLGSALRTAIDRQGGSRVAAVVVLSDGRLTRGEDPAFVAEQLVRRKIPVHTVGVGDPSPARNLRVTTVFANERVFAGDPVAVDVQIEHLGYGGETVRVELAEEYLPERGVESAQRILDTIDVVIDDQNPNATANFKIELTEVGRHELKASVAVRPEESLSDDNERRTVVEVVEEASRVLLVAGAPSYEYRFLKNLLFRDPRTHLAAWLMSADADYPQEGNESLKKLPTGPEDLFEYDVVILVDTDPAGLPPGFAELMERFVGKHGGGLLYVAGEKYTAKVLSSTGALAPLADILPVLPDLGRAEAQTGRGRFHERAWPLVPTSLASSHPPTRLSSRPERNRQRWEELEGIYWAFPVRKAKPGANVLLVHSDPSRTLGESPEPILLWQYYDAGRTVFLATDETWRWRSTTEEIYDQFWVQSVRFLTEGRLTSGKRHVLQTDSEIYELGDVIRVSAMLHDSNYEPLSEESQTLSIQQPDGSLEDLQLEQDAAAPEWYRGVLVPRSRGEYRLRLKDKEAREIAVTVKPPEIEFREPQLDEATLRTLARLTGGTYSDLSEVGEVPDRIPDRRETVITTDEPILLWDNWVSLALLATVLTLEWILRKWNRLL